MQEEIQKYVEEIRRSVEKVEAGLVEALVEKTLLVEKKIDDTEKFLAKNIEENREACDRNVESTCVRKIASEVRKSVEDFASGRLEQLLADKFRPEIFILTDTLKHVEVEVNEKIEALSLSCTRDSETLLALKADMETLLEDITHKALATDFHNLEKRLAKLAHAVLTLTQVVGLNVGKLFAPAERSSKRSKNGNGRDPQTTDNSHIQEQLSLSYASEKSVVSSSDSSMGSDSRGAWTYEIFPFRC